MNIEKQMIDGGCPAFWAAKLAQYVETGEAGGSFLYAVLSNELQQAFGRADDQAARDLHAIVRAVYSHVPSVACGSPADVRAWSDKGGLQGIRAEITRGARVEPPVREEYTREIKAAVNVCRRMIERGFSAVNLNDGFDSHPLTNDLVKIEGALTGLDEAHVHFTKDGKKDWIHFVFGNGDDCVCADCSGGVPDDMY